MATLGSLSPVSSACAGEETAALRQEPQPLGRRSECPPLERFPLTLLSHTATFLNERDLVNFLSTCRHVKECGKHAREQRDIILSKSFSPISLLLCSFPQEDDLIRNILTCLKEINNIKNLNLTVRFIGDIINNKFYGFWNEICELNNLQKLIIDGGYSFDATIRHRLTDDHLSYLCGLQIRPLSKTKLQDFSLITLDRITNSGLAHVSTLHDLQKIYLKALPGLTDNGLAHLSSMPNLQSLTLESLPKFTDNGLQHLMNFHNLQKLFLRRLEGVTDNSLAHIRCMHSLQSLALEEVEKVTDIGLNHLIALHNLQELILVLKEPTNKGIEYISEMDNLQELTLKLMKATDDSFMFIERMNKLRELTLGGFDIEGNGFKYLSSMCGLQKLALMGLYHFKDYDFAYITHMPNLQILMVQDSWPYPITDKGLEHISRMHGLRELILDGLQNVTDAGIAPLYNMQTLKQLTLNGQFKHRYFKTED
jgi:hypothetical protein